MASAQQLIGLVKSHAEGDADRFYDLAMQLSASEEQKGHTRLAEQLRQWAEAGQKPPASRTPAITPIAAPRGDMAEFLAASYPAERLNDVILPSCIEDELAHIVVETKMREKLEEKGLKPRRRVLLSGPPGTGENTQRVSACWRTSIPTLFSHVAWLDYEVYGRGQHKNSKWLFDAVKTTRGVYLFDEIDALAAARGGENDVGEARRVLNSFLQFLDDDAGPSIVVATTNLPDILDRAVLRRFDLVLPYEMPDAPSIQQAIERRLFGFSIAGMSWKKITGYADGLSTADVVAAAEDAARRAVLSDIDEIATQDLIAAIERRRALQGLGLDGIGKNSSTHSSSQPGQRAPVSSQGRGRVKKSK